MYIWNEKQKEKWETNKWIDKSANIQTYIFYIVWICKEKINKTVSLEKKKLNENKTHYYKIIIIITIVIIIIIIIIVINIIIDRLPLKAGNFLTTWKPLVYQT